MYNEYPEGTRARNGLSVMIGTLPVIPSLGNNTLVGLGDVATHLSASGPDAGTWSLTYRSVNRYEGATQDAAMLGRKNKAATDLAKQRARVEELRALGPILTDAEIVTMGKEVSRMFSKRHQKEYKR